MSKKVAKRQLPIATTSNERLLTIYAPKNCMRHVGKLRTMEDAITAPAPTLGTFTREKGRPFTEAYVMLWLVYINDILNLRRPMNEDQITYCATQIVSDFYLLKVTDLSLLAKRIISGEFGEYYESLSIPKVISFFRKYTESRLDLAARQSQQRHADRSSDETFNYTSNLKRMFRGGRGFRSKK